MSAFTPLSLDDSVPNAAATPWHLGFPAAVEARFEADTGLRRSRELFWTGLVGLLVYDLFLLNDALNRPQVLGLALFCRLGLVSPYGLLMLALIRRGLPPLWRELAMASCLLVAMGGSGLIFRATDATGAGYDAFTFSLFFLVGHIVFRLRAAVALGYAVLGVTLTCVLLLGHATLSVQAVSFALMLVLATAVFTTLACYRLERAERQAYLLIRRETERSQVALQAAEAMAALSHTDPLTQLANRRAFDHELPRRWDEAARHDQPMSALLIDIDHFKRFNDRFGHPAGDDCLREVAAVMRANLREGDFLARIGGEEFAVLLQGGAPQGAKGFAERLRHSVQQAGIPHAPEAGASTVVTVSVGLAQLQARPHEPHSRLIEAADAALYEAKRQGRNRCVAVVGGPAGSAVGEGGVSSAPSATATRSP